MRNAEIVWKFETKNFRVECLFAPDGDVDTSFDDTGETAANLDSGLWQAFCTEVRVIHKNTGIELGSDVLGGSIYAEPLDFIKEHYGCRPNGFGSYFPDMVRNAIREARSYHGDIAATRLRTDD